MSVINLIYISYEIHVNENIQVKSVMLQCDFDISWYSGQRHETINIMCKMLLVVKH